MDHTISHHVHKLQEAGMDPYAAQRVGAFVEDARKGLVTREDLRAATDVINANMDARISKLETKLVLLFLGTYAAVPFVSALVSRYLFK